RLVLRFGLQRTDRRIQCIQFFVQFLRLRFQPSRFGTFLQLCIRLLPDFGRFLLLIFHLLTFGYHLFFHIRRRCIGSRWFRTFSVVVTIIVIAATSPAGPTSLRVCTCGGRGGGRPNWWGGR